MLLSLFTILSYDVYNTSDYGTDLMFGARGIGALIGPIIVRYFFGNTDGKLIKVIGPCIMAWGLCYFFIPLSSSLYLTVFLTYTCSLRRRLPVGFFSLWTTDFDTRSLKRRYTRYGLFFRLFI